MNQESRQQSIFFRKNDQTIRGYDKRASSYERKWQAYLKHTHEAFLARIETARDDTILDISGGTGMLAKLLIERDYSFRHLVINDPSGGMLDIARRRLSSEPKILFSNYRAEEISYKANYFDRIFCLNSFHFYTRQRLILDRCYTMLKPGGTLCILDWNRTGFFSIINALIKWSASEYIDTRSLAECKSMFQKSGFAIDKTDNWSWRFWKFFFTEAEKPV